MRLLPALLFMVLVSACSNTNQEQKRWEDQKAGVTIIRDDFGVPHIYGKTDANAVFGLLYAQCEDDFNRVERNYLWATGRLAEVEGKEQLYSDLRANLFMTKEEAIEQYDKSPEWLRKLCDAFADGINYYLFTHPEVKPKLLTHFEPWMPMYFFEGSIGGDIESISTDGIQKLYDSINGVSSVQNRSGLAQHQELVEPQGSNGFAISGKLTQSGKAMLLINPHTSFFFRGEVHVVSEEGLNVYGAVTWGQFFVYQGFNEKNGWMHTSSYTDVMDEFVEKVTQHKDGKLFYQDGKVLMEVVQKKVNLKYVDGDSVKEKSFTVYRTHHGPVTHLTNGYWTATAMNWNPAKALEQSFLRTKTTSHKAFLEVMDIRTNSSNNTVYADAEGNIALYQGNFIPKRDVQFDYSKPVDGSNPATAWKGLHEVSEEIHVLNPPNGWIQNCNSTPFTSALEFSPKKENYPYYMATEPENFRGIHAQRVLTGRSGYTLDKLIETAYDPYLPAFEKLIPGLVDAFDKKGKNYAALKPAIDTLRKWNMKVSKESIGMSLAHFYISLYMQKGERDPELELIDVINYFGTGSPLDERLEIFSLTVKKLNEDFGTWNTPWGEINRLQRLTGDIKQPFDDSKPSTAIGMASGNWGALASFGARGTPTTKRIYGTYGNSFVAVVEFGDKVKAKSILAGGQSGDPSSPHFYDQAQRYADVQFKEVAYYKEDVEAKAKKTYRPGDK
jgi:acyl-homoserine-lactone acylase